MFIGHSNWSIEHGPFIDLLVEYGWTIVILLSYVLSFHRTTQVSFALVKARCWKQLVHLWHGPWRCYPCLAMAGKAWTNGHQNGRYPLVTKITIFKRKIHMIIFNSYMLNYQRVEISGKWWNFHCDVPCFWMFWYRQLCSISFSGAILAWRLEVRMTRSKLLGLHEVVAGSCRCHDATAWCAMYHVHDASTNIYIYIHM